jgi:hypothetical protein
MITNVEPAVRIEVELVEPDKEYKVLIQKPGEQPITRALRFRQQSQQRSDDEIGFDALEVKLKNIRKDIEGFGHINLYLPDDRIAGQAWEGLGRGRVIRRRERDYGFRRSPITGPLRMGIVSTVPAALHPYVGLENAISGSAAGAVELQTIDVRDWEHFEEAIRLNRFHALHIMVQTELTPDGPQIVLGGKRVPLNRVIERIARPGTRFVVLQDVTQQPHGIAALRWGAQSLPSECETSMVLCTAAPSAQFAGTMKGCYEGLLRDEPLTNCMAGLERHERGSVSLITHTGAHSGLGILEDLGFSRRRHDQIAADIDRLHRPERILIGQDPIRIIAAADTSGTGALDVVAELMGSEPTTRSAETKLKEEVRKVIAKSNGNQPRYPAAWFYHVDAASETPIPDTETLTWPPSVGIVLEFHFWLDIVKTGIASITEPPEFQKPEHVPYPLTLQVTVWSDDFEFTTREGKITLQASGPTEHAKFPVKKLPAPPRQVELFVFLQHEGTLIAAFRVEAGLTDEAEHYSGAQIVEHAYVSNEWFHFENAPEGSALTIFITKKDDALRLFTLKATGNPWATLGPSEDGLYRKNKEIYKEVQTLARRAEQAAKDKEEFSFTKEAKRLAQLGYPLFGALFLQGQGVDAVAFADDYLRKLPEGSSVTIAIGRKAQDLYIPWGLLYDRQPPFEYFDAPQMMGFLGYKYNLVVRPSTHQDCAGPKRQLPIRMGAAWLEHEETAPLRAFYKPYEKAKKLVIEPILAKDHSLPDLVSKEYDLVEFFCHGHTKLEGVFSADEVAQLLDSYSKSATGGKNNPLLMAIDASGDSLLDISGGFVTLTSLADSLKKPMPGRPLILLSMCESAQVSAAGLGFVPLFLGRGARAVIGTEGPTLWKLSREMDTQIVARLLDGQTISRAFYETRKELAKTNMLALIYTLYGDAGAKLV